MRADDDGFIGNPKRIKSLIGASDDDLKLLIVKRFILAFEDGVIVIKHWKMHNTIQKDRYTPTTYQDELSMLLLKGNKSYSFNTGNTMETKCIQNVSSDIGIGLDTDLDKEEELIGDKSPTPTKKRSRFVPPTVEEVQAYCDERNNGIDAGRFIDFYSAKNWMIGKNKMADWKAAVRTWESKNKPVKPQAPKREKTFEELMEEMPHG
jgi:hypothetical protein